MFVRTEAYMTIFNVHREKSCMFISVVLCNPSWHRIIIKSNHRSTIRLSMMKITHNMVAMEKKWIPHVGANELSESKLFVASKNSCILPTKLQQFKHWAGRLHAMYWSLLNMIWIKEPDEQLNKDFRSCITSAKGQRLRPLKCKRKGQ